MRTQPNQSWVSVASGSAGACAGRQHPATQTEGAASDMTVEPQAELLQFDNQATVYVDVYLVSDQLQWRLGRVPPGFRAALRIPESVIPRTLGLVQLAVIPGSLISAEAWRDPHAVIAVLQPVSEVLSQSWTFRQPVGAALQLQATRLRRQP